MNISSLATSIYNFSLFSFEDYQNYTPSSFFVQTLHRVVQANMLLDNTFNFLSPMSLLVSQTDNDTYTYGEMMKQDD